MFTNAHEYVQQRMHTDKLAFFSHEAAVSNFSMLGAFTGSRVGEYGQTKAPRGVYNTIPKMADSGEWRRMPLEPSSEATLPFGLV